MTDPTESLQNGNTEFLKEMKYNERLFLVKKIRKTVDKTEFIKSFLTDEVMRDYPSFIFALIYDNDDFENETKELFSFNNGSLANLSIEQFTNLLNDTKWGSKYIYDNFDKLILTNEKVKIKLIIKKIFNGDPLKEDFINKFLGDINLHRRAIFLKYTTLDFPKEAEKLYENIDKILEYRFIDNKQTEIVIKMSEIDLSKVIVQCLHSKLDKSIFDKLKEYLFKNYPKNDLAELLIPVYTNDKVAKEDEKIFIANADQLFLTSRRYQYFIINRYSDFLCQQILDEYRNLVRLSQAYGCGDNMLCPSMQKLYIYDLGNELKRIVDQYLSLSKTDKINYLSSGTRNNSFRVGDYTLKIGSGKWSYEKVICPNLFLFLKNIEEYYIREANELVIANLEVQPYISKKPYHFSSSQLKRFIDELKNLGYYTTDPNTLRGSVDNFGVLDSYKDADCDDPEQLPDYFKSCPIVLYDRDLIFKIGEQPKDSNIGGISFSR